MLSRSLEFEEVEDVQNILRVNKCIEVLYNL